MPELKEPSKERARLHQRRSSWSVVWHTLFYNGLLRQNQDATSVALFLGVILTKQSSVHFTHWWLWLRMVPLSLFMLIVKWNRVSRLREIENRTDCCKGKWINKSRTSRKDTLLQYWTPSGCCSGTTVSWSQSGLHSWALPFYCSLFLLMFSGCAAIGFEIRADHVLCVTLCAVLQRLFVCLSIYTFNQSIALCGEGLRHFA